MDFGLPALRCIMSAESDQGTPLVPASLAKQLEAAELRFRNLIDHAPIAVLRITLEGKVLMANPALAELLGYASVPEFMAQPGPELKRHIQPADLERLASLVRSGRRYAPIEVRLRKVDDSYVWVDILAQLEIGVGERVVEVFVRDLTQVRAIQLASSRLAAVMNSVDDAIIGIDRHGIVGSWNRGATKLYGYKETESIGRPLADIYVPQAMLPEWNATLARLLAGQRVSKFDTQRRHKNGSLREVAVAANRVLDAHGQSLGVSFIENDVRERDRSQRALIANERQQQEVLHLEALTRMRNEFMGKASHELNTPLTPVLLGVQSLKEIPDLDAKQALSLASIERNVIRLAGVVKDLVTAADLNLSRLDLNPTEIDLRELLVDVMESFEPQAAKRQVALITTSKDPVLAFADRERVLQVMFNLVGNAIKFTPSGGTVTVDAAAEPGGGTVLVTDTGLGFSEDARSGLFLPFGRLHEDKPGAPPGSGLGLFISKGIIEQSGGEIWAKSPGPDKGCTFGIRLPVPVTIPRPGRGIRAAQGFGVESNGPVAEPAEPHPERQSRILSSRRDPVGQQP